MPRCLIGLGANLGDRAEALAQAALQLSANPDVRVLAQSRNVETAPVGGPPGQPAFLNAALLLETSLSPQQLLDLLERIEKEQGRQRQVRWDARTLDLDLLLYDQLMLETPRLVIPHPRMAVRRFVLEPAAQIAGDMVDPATGSALEQLWRHLLSALPYVAVAGAPHTGKTRLAEHLAATPGRRFIADSRAAQAPASTPLDSSSRAVRTEIEFLASRQRLLSRAAWKDAEDWTVSDFWLDQSLAWSAGFDAAEQAEVFAAWREAVREVVPPKLLIVLQGRRADDAETERVADAIDRLSRRPGNPPALRLPADDRQTMLQEAAAALLSMR